MCLVNEGGSTRFHIGEPETHRLDTSAAMASARHGVLEEGKHTILYAMDSAQPDISE